ncbi:unnamed protein product [Durusdinium trenchii]|uniref:DNA-directed DNA polymerase n=1 Tax=Durusdinium trenchii TaxID=1381693 RepID=A0ABP0N1S6_9DINO
MSPEVLKARLGRDCNQVGWGAELDVADCFYQFEMKQLAKWFGIDDPRKTADWAKAGVDITEVYDEDLETMVLLNDDTVVYPVIGAMPMGWTWALFFANETVAAIARATAPERPLECREKLPTPQLWEGETITSTYVDNVKIQEVARVREKWRFIPMPDDFKSAIEFFNRPGNRGEVESREHIKAFVRAGVGPNTEYGVWLQQALVDGNWLQTSPIVSQFKAVRKRREDVEVPALVEPIPSDMVSEGSYKLLWMRKWRNPDEHINIKEGRVSSMKLLSGTTQKRKSHSEKPEKFEQRLLCGSFLSVAATSARLWEELGSHANSVPIHHRKTQPGCGVTTAWLDTEEVAPASVQHAHWASQWAFASWQHFQRQAGASLPPGKRALRA